MWRHQRDRHVRNNGSSASHSGGGKERSFQVLEFRATESREINNLLDTTSQDDGAVKNDRRVQATLYKVQDDAEHWTKEKKEIYPQSQNNTTTMDLRQSLYENVVLYFLPAQYPASVANGYARFSALAFSASIAGSAAMVLSTQTLLLAVGVVGNTAAAAGNASVMAGALNWVLKDGIGQLGGVLFASKMGEMKRFDSDPKRWRMLAALSLDGASLIEILSPLVWSSWVLPVACVANIGKNIGFLTASASRAAIHQSLAVKGNLADVTAKSASQSMAAGLLGTTVGIGLSTLLQHDTTNFIMGFCALSIVHQGCNYASLKSVPLLHFNRHRLHLLLSHYIDTESILTPREVAVQESYFPLVAHSDDTHTWLSVGSSLHEFCPGAVSDFEQLRILLPDERYLLNAVNGRVHLVFLGDATGDDLIMGMYHAHRLKTVLANDSKVTGHHAIAASYAYARSDFPSLLSQLHSLGWKTGTEVTSIEASDSYRLSIQSTR